MSAVVFGLSRFDTCWTLAILSFSVPIGSEVFSPLVSFFCSCTILSAGQKPVTNWYTAATTSIFAAAALGAVYLGRRLQGTGACEEPAVKTFRLSVFSGFVGTEKELVIALATSILLLLLQLSQVHTPTWFGLGLITTISLLFALSSKVVEMAAREEDRHRSPSFVPFIAMAIIVGYFARAPTIDKRWAHLALAFGLAMIALEEEEHRIQRHRKLDGIDESDNMVEEGAMSMVNPDEVRCVSRVQINESSNDQLQPLRKRLVIFALVSLPIAIALIQQAAELCHLNHSGFVMRADGPVGIVRSSAWKAQSDYDLVISYYEEDLDTIRQTIEQVKKRLPSGMTSRTIVYAKGPNSASRATMIEFLQQIDADQIVALKNVGREGETYLQHIVRYYSSKDSPLATHTIFLQPHIPWPGTAFPRLESMTANTGFMSLSTYVNASCPSDGSEIDLFDQVHPRIAQIYSSFQQDLYPPTGFTITWFGQFVVSRRRIHNNPLKAYKNLLSYFDVPVGEGNAKDWIWDEGWWNNTTHNPTLGHALERSWPAIFGCSDLRLALECKDQSGSHCMCMD